MRKIDTLYGSSIETTLHKLKSIAAEIEEPVSTEFNKKLLTSEMTLDECYVLVTGKTKSDFDLELKKYQEEQEIQKLRHEDSIPELTKYWIEEGKKYLRKEDLEFWNEIVPIRLRDLYRGMELECLINIVKILNKSSNLLEVFEEAKEELDNQGHSGMSFGLVCSMLVRFHKHGEKFVAMVN